MAFRCAFALDTILDRFIQLCADPIDVREIERARAKLRGNPLTRIDCDLDQLGRVLRKDRCDACDEHLRITHVERRVEFQEAVDRLDQLQAHRLLRRR